MADLIGHFVVPSGVMVVLLVVAALLAVFRRTRWLSKVAAISALAVYVVFGSGPVAYSLLGPLERAYPSVTDIKDLEDIDVIVVLTGYASVLDSVSPPSWLNESSAYRVLELLRVENVRPEARVLVSGTLGSSITIRDVLVSLGMNPAQIRVDRDAIDTGVSAQALIDSVQPGERCALVTSAGHMPRAMMAFHHAGRDCLAVPTEFYTPFPLDPLGYLPSPGKLKLSDLAIHEYLGIAWYWVRGRL
ncbi:MAG: ElyC/SanA/YdcF family protein [Pseudomonadales bacterium]